MKTKFNKDFPKVSFLMLNWNGASFTRKCITSLLDTKYPNFEIVVVDNGSVNNEAEKLKKEFKKKIKVIKNDINVGYAAGMNIAIKNSRGDYVMILNNDMGFSNNWLQPLVDVLKHNKNVGAVQPKINDIKKKNYFEAGGAAGGFMDILGYPFARGRIFSTVEKDTGQYDEPARVSWAGVILLKREVIDKVGVFNPIYFNYGEDMDICYRIYGQGYVIVNIPSSVVYHVGGAALKKDMSRKFFFHHRNNVMFLLINERLLYLFLLLPLRFFLDMITIFYYILSGYPKLAHSVIKAYVSLIIKSKKIFIERKKTQKKIDRSYLSDMPIYNGSIVWEYFIRKNRIFSSLVEQASFCGISLVMKKGKGLKA